MSDDYFFDTSDNEKIRITTYGGADKELKSCIFFVHGFKGFKDWGFVPYLCSFLADKGFFVVSFNFSLNGIGDNLTEFTELEKFAKNTISREVRELNELIDAYFDGFFGPVSNKNIGLIGHSRGGAVSLLASAHKKVGAVCTWSAISKLDRYTERQKNEWKEKGVFEVLNTRTNQVMKMNYSYLKDVLTNSNLSIQQAVGNLKKPLLIIHGEQDLGVPISEAQNLFEWSNRKNTELEIIAATGHTFDVVHPFAGSNEKFDSVLNKTNKFFKDKLN